VLLAAGLHFGLEGGLTFVMYLAMFGAFLVSILRWPSAGIYVLTFALPLQTVRYRFHTYPLGAQFLDIILLGSILGLMFRRQPLIPKFPIMKLLLAVAVFYYFSLWEGAFFTDVPLPLSFGDQRFSDWKNYVEMFLLAGVVASSIKDKRGVKLLILVMCLSVLLVNRSFSSAMADQDVSHFSEDVRNSGPLGYAGVNGFAAFEAMFGSFLLGLYVYQKKLVVKLGILCLIGSCVYCVLYAFSRGGYIGLLVGFIAVGTLKARHFLILALFVVIAWQFVLPASVQERITMTTEGETSGQKFDSSSQERLTLWEDALDLFRRNPVTGTGFDTYGSMKRVGPYADTHNYYLKVLVETGVVGLGLYLFLLISLVRMGGRLFFGSKDAFWASIGLGFLALLMSAIILNFFGDRWTYQQVDGYLWIFLGFVIRGLMQTQQEAGTENTALTPGPSEVWSMALPDDQAEVQMPTRNLANSNRGQNASSQNWQLPIGAHSQSQFASLEQTAQESE
jgi:O-antigen ligase